MLPNYDLKSIKDQIKHNRLSDFFFGIFIALILLVLGFGVTTLFYTTKSVIMVQFDDQQCFIKDHFDLKWTHSVEKQSWIESYRLVNQHLLLTDTYLQTFGAGTPSTESIGENSDLYPGYVNYEVNVQLPYLNWIISSNIEAEIITLDKTLPIYKWVDDYTNIYIYPTTQNLWMLIRQESCNEYA